MSDKKSRDIAYLMHEVWLPWTHEMSPITKERASILLGLKKFQNEILALRKEFNIPEDGFVYSKGDLRLFRELSKGIGDLRYKFNLPPYWHDFLKHYIIYNELIEINDAPRLYQKDSPNERDTAVYLRIWDHTTAEDLESILGFVKEYFPNYFKFHKERYKLKNEDNLKRDTVVLDMHMCGLSNKEIVNELADIAADLPEKTRNLYYITEDRITRILHSIKSTLKLPTA